MQLSWPELDGLLSYALGYGKITLLLLLAWALLRTAPAVWRFRLAIVGLAAGLIPWHRWPGWTLNSSASRCASARAALEKAAKLQSRIFRAPE